MVQDLGEVGKGVGWENSTVCVEKLVEIFLEKPRNFPFLNDFDNLHCPLCVRLTLYFSTV